MGLWKEDVDLDVGTLTIRRSWTQRWPKDVDPRCVLIVPELRLYLVEALEVSKNHLVSPRADGKAFEPDTRRLLMDHLRRALRHVGLVVGYDHTCRRCKARARRAEAGEGIVFAWRNQDAEQRLCPTCGMKLWAKPIPRALRFYDLRHKHATILRKVRVDLGTVQKALGHSSPEITAGTYDHSELEDDRAALERALTFRAVTPPQIAATSPDTPGAAAEGASGMRTTGAPALVAARTHGAYSADLAAEGDRTTTGGCDPVRPLLPVATAAKRDSGPSALGFPAPTRRLVAAPRSRCNPVPGMAA